MKKLICRLFGHKPVFVKKGLDNSGWYWRFKYRCDRCGYITEFAAGTPDEEFVRSYLFGGSK